MTVIIFSLSGSAKKLFKDYAFLLTNADRKVAVVKQQFDTSDSDAVKEGMF